MNRRLNDYLKKRDAEPLDESVLKEYATVMKEQTIPEIEREFRKNEERAAELRFSPGPVSRRQRGVAVRKRRGKQA